MAEKDTLLNEWIKVKKAEDKQKQKRLELEKEIESLYGDFEGKSKTFSEESGYKVNIKKNVAYNLDQEMWKSVRKDIPEELRPEKISFSVDVKAYEWLQENKPEIYIMASDCVEIKNNKSTIKVEKI